MERGGRLAALPDGGSDRRDHHRGGRLAWLSGRFVPFEGFAEMKPLFERELALLEADEHGDWDAVVREIGEKLQLVAPAGPVAEFLLHTDGERAWFRWSDEPFD